MSSATYCTTYPAAMNRSLRRIRARQMTLAVLRAGLIGLATLAIAMLVAMTIDWSVTLFSTTARFLLTSLAFIAAAAALVLSGYRPIRDSIRLSRAAEVADQVIPQLQERWVTVASFVESNREPSSRLEQAMLQQVTSEAVTMVRLVRPAAVASNKQVTIAALVAFSAVLALVAFMTLDWQYTGTLLRRFFFPLSNISSTRLESVTGDLRSPRNEPAVILVRMSGILRESAWLEVAAEGADIHRVELTPDERQHDHFTYAITALDGSFRYRAVAGDGRTDWYSVTALDRPTLAEVNFSVVAPPYVDRPKYEKEYIPDHVRAAQGSLLKLEMRARPDLNRCELELRWTEKSEGSVDLTNAAEELVSLRPDRDGWYRYELMLERDVQLTPILLSQDGLEGRDLPSCKIRVIPDQPPVARVLTPTDEMAVAADEVIDIQFEAHDDHGIAKAELVVYEESDVAGEPGTIVAQEQIPLGDFENERHVLARAQLDLSKYSLNQGERLSFAIRVIDNRASETPSDPSDDEAKQPDAANELQARPGTAMNNSPGTDSATHDLPDSTSQPQAIAASGTDTERLDNEVIATSDPNGSGKDGRSSETNEQTVEAEMPERTSEKGQVQDDGIDTSPSSSEPAETTTEISQSGKSNAPTESDIAAQPQPANVGSDKPAEAVVEGSEKQSADNSLNAQPGTRGDNVEQAKTDPSGSTVSPQQSSREPGSPNPPNSFAANNRPAGMKSDLPGQRTESNRLKLKVVEKLVSAEPAPEILSETIQIKIRERLEQIDRELEPCEEFLSTFVTAVSSSRIVDSQLFELKGHDQRLAKAERIVADLRAESKDTRYAFVGLQMMEIAAAHISPGRDRLFTLIHQPDVDRQRNAAEAIARVSRARELLAELLVRYERVLREEKLAQTIEETAKIYEVYVENLHRFLLAQSRPNDNPLDRKMAIVEVDQEYLDRLRQVSEMRRDLMAEFGRMLGDDPRLRSKYMDLVKRRQTSLRDRLTQLNERQDQLATELSGWLRVDKTQQEDVWLLIAESRLREFTPLAQEAAQLEERIVSQFPLSLDKEDPKSLAILEYAKQAAVHARTTAAKAKRMARDPLGDDMQLTEDLDSMSVALSETLAALQLVAFASGDDEATVDYVDKRSIEIQAVATRSVMLVQTATHLQSRKFERLVMSDQHQIALDTELLRAEVQGIDEQLEGQFRGQVPAAVTTIAEQLKQTMEAITFNQMAATFELSKNRLNEAEQQQAIALENFQLAEKLFDEIRRKIVEELDKIDPENPNIAELVDPTLDEILARLEREPNLNALLGIPNRPQNLRVISDFLVSQEGNTPIPTAMEEAVKRARRRAGEEEKPIRKMRQQDDKSDLTEKEWREVADAEQAQAKLEEKIKELRNRADDPSAEPDEAEKLKQLVRQLEAMKQAISSREINDQQWDEMVRSDQMQAVLRAAAKGEPLPDTSWNRLMSSLDDGLWQVRRRTPPEEFRRAIEQYQERIRRISGEELADDQ